LPDQGVHPIEKELFNHPAANVIDPNPDELREEKPREEKPGNLDYELLPLDDDDPIGQSGGNPANETSASLPWDPNLTGVDPLAPTGTIPHPPTPTPATPVQPTNLPWVETQSPAGVAVEGGVAAAAAANVGSSSQPQTGSISTNSSSPGEGGKPNEGGAAPKKEKSDAEKGFVDDFVDAGKFLLKGFKSQELLARAGMLVIVLSIAYLGMSFSYGLIQSENSVTSMLGFIPAFLSGGIMIGAMIFIGVFMHTIILQAAYDDTKAADWPDLDIGEWMGQFLFVGFAFWASALPGVMFGLVLVQLTGMIGLLTVCMGISALVLGPGLMMSAFYNGSFFKIVSPEIFQSFNKFPRQWAVFYAWIGVFLLTFLFAGLIGLINVCGVSILIAIVHTLLVVGFSRLIGYQCREVIIKMQDANEAESS
jgi:hypothetical protein